jgi:hypothetical protein
MIGGEVQRGLERLDREVIAPESEPAPAEPVRQAVPAGLPPQAGLEDDGGRAVLAQMVVGPPEEGVGLVVRLVEGDGVKEAVPRRAVISGLVEHAALPQ